MSDCNLLRKLVIGSLEMASVHVKKNDLGGENK